MAEQFGRYEILDRIGIGGMAEVYRARAYGAEGFRKTLVVKKILPHLSDDPRFRTMFVDEAKIAVALQHQNVVQILDLGRIDDQLFIAMELVDGADLARTFLAAAKKRMRFPLEVSLFIVKEALKGLNYAHTKIGPEGRELGIIHRDISPANILLSFAGEVKIGDFGIAKAAERSGNTKTGVVKGKLHYMSPEQLKGEPLDPRCDVYGMGMVLHTLLSGQHPFEGMIEVDVIDAIRAGEVELPSYFNPNIDDDLDKIVKRAIARISNFRFDTAAEFSTAIERYAVDRQMYLDGSALPAFLKEVFEGDEQTQIQRAEEAASVGASIVRRMDSDERTATVSPSDAGLTILRSQQTSGETVIVQSANESTEVSHSQAGEMTHPIPWRNRRDLEKYIPLGVIGIVVLVAVVSLYILISGPNGANTQVSPTPVITPIPGMGLLDFDVKPWADVWINGNRAGSTPLMRQLKPATYSIEYETPDGKKRKTTVEIREGQTRVLHL